VVKAKLDARRLDGYTEVPWSLPSLRWVWNRAKADVAPWWKDNSKEAYSSGLDSLARALANFSASCSGERRGHSKFPRFRRRGRIDSCRFTTGVIRIDDHMHVALNRMGRLRTAESTIALRRRIANGIARIVSATISREADRWYVSFSCDVMRPASSSNGHSDTIGVDVGYTALPRLQPGR